MKKSISFLICLLLVLTILYPAGVIISACFGYNFELVSISAFALAIAILSLCIVILNLIFKNKLENKTVQILSAIITPLSLINAVFYILKCSQPLVITSVFISAGCCCYLTAKHGKPLALQITTIALSALMVVPIGFLSFFILIFGSFGQNTVVKTIESPSGEYYAQVIDSDQGALGGSTFVDVYKSDVSLILFKLEKKSQRVYFGTWGEFENMQIHWKDNNRLIINSVEYEIQ